MLAILLGFPVLDCYLTVQLANLSGIPVAAWMALGLVAGWMLLRAQRLNFRARTLAAMYGPDSLLRGLLDSGRKVLAGFLFLLPGVLSDCMALLLLLVPINVGPLLQMQSSTQPGMTRRPDTLDGDFRRLD
ncbi:MAG: FxsA family protein [Betaproteobacteria bacterium]|nr:FxsA family protein [Betaproteobacteria bacterium]